MRMLLLGASICWTPYLLPIDDSGIAKRILDKIFRITCKGDPIQWLTRAIMNEHIFKTMTDTEEIREKLTVVFPNKQVGEIKLK